MTTKSNAELLAIIADMIGVDSAIFRAQGDAYEAEAADDGAPPDNFAMLSRLIRAFKALPSDERRLQVLLMVEGLAESTGSLC